MDLCLCFGGKFGQLGYFGTCDYSKPNNKGVFFKNPKSPTYILDNQLSNANLVYQTTYEAVR